MRPPRISLLGLFGIVTIAALVVSNAMTLLQLESRSRRLASVTDELAGLRSDVFNKGFMGVRVIRERQGDSVRFELRLPTHPSDISKLVHVKYMFRIVHANISKDGTQIGSPGEMSGSELPIVADSRDIYFHDIYFDLTFHEQNDGLQTLHIGYPKGVLK